MGAPYTSTSVTNYNSNPPPDDGSQTEANRVKWATIKTKLSDPLNTFAAAVNSAISTAFGKVVGGAGVTTSAISYTVLSADQGKLVVATGSGGITITTPDATDVGAPFVFDFMNDCSAAITFDGNGSQTIDGDASFSVPAGKGFQCRTDGTNWFTNGRNWDTSNLPAGHIFGLTCSNAADTTNDITVAAGRCRDSSNAVDLIISSALTKQIDASWVAGTNQGGRSSAGLADDTWHLFAIGKALGADADILFHNAVDPSAVLPTNYLYYRRIMSIPRESSALVQFAQDGDYFLRKTLTTIISANNPGTSAVTRTLDVPTDIKVRADIIANVKNTSATTLTYSLFTDLDSTDDTPSVDLTNAPPAYAGAQGVPSAPANLLVTTNTSGQIRSRISYSDSAVTVRVSVRGWVDTRGRLA